MSTKKNIEFHNDYIQTFSYDYPGPICIELIFFFNFSSFSFVEANLPNGMPKITSQPKIIESSPNYGVDLKCKSDGRQPMQVTWFKFGAPLHSDNPVKWIVTPDGTLMILTPVKSDSGLYECMVTNDVGAAMTSQPTQLIINKGENTNTKI